MARKDDRSGGGKQTSVQPPGRPMGKGGEIGPGKQHSSVPSRGRKNEPMVSQDPPPGQQRPIPGTRRQPATDTPADEEV